MTTGDGERKVGFSRAQPALTQIQQKYLEIWYQEASDVGLHSSLDNVRFYELSPERMREPSLPGVAMFGDSGES